MRIIRGTLVSIVFLLLTNILICQENGRVSVSQEVQVLSKGTKNIFRSDIFYNKEKDVVIVHHTYPAEFIKISNRLGEEKIYFPPTNSVTVQQSEAFSTTNDLLYYFVNNKMSDMGLAKEGFRLSDSKREDGLMVTTWLAPLSLKVIGRIKLVFQDIFPVYAEYLDTKGNIIKKIYYSKYCDLNSFSLPLRITEIAYNGKADSTIRLSVFSNVRISDFPENSYFDFKVPDNAKASK